MKNQLILPNVYDADLLSEKTALRCEDKSLTHQSFKEECDINTILDRFGITGELPENLEYSVNTDFAETFDFQSAQNQLIEAKNSFMALPAKVRSRFDNDPGLFVDFCSDPNNVQEMIDLGLAVKVQPKAAINAPEVQPKAAIKAPDLAQSTDSP